MLDEVGDGGNLHLPEVVHLHLPEVVYPAPSGGRSATEVAETNAPSEATALWILVARHALWDQANARGFRQEMPSTKVAETNAPSEEAALWILVAKRALWDKANAGGFRKWGDCRTRSSPSTEVAQPKAPSEETALWILVARQSRRDKAKAGGFRRMSAWPTRCSPSSANTGDRRKRQPSAVVVDYRCTHVMQDKDRTMDAPEYP